MENAGIKSFAEIMAEKKRKRLLAQQESKKNITPIVFEDKPGKSLRYCRSGNIRENLIYANIRELVASRIQSSR